MHFWQAAAECVSPGSAARRFTPGQNGHWYDTGYTALNRRERGLVRRYLAQMTGLSRARVTRLIASYIDSGRVKAAVYQRTKFATRHTKSDVELLAYVDKRAFITSMRWTK